MDASECVFCKIAAGAIPSLHVLETPSLLAFLDVGPLAAGHTLLIPKQHYESILDVPEDVLGSLACQLPKLARAVMRATGATAFVSC